MKIRESIIRLLGGEIREGARRAPLQPLKSASFMDTLETPAIESTMWRRLTGNANRELIPVTQDRMIEIAYWLSQTNPLAGWLIDVTTSFILAEGLPYEAKHEETKAVLDGFWNDPVNRLDLYFAKHVSELHIFGELCLPAFTAQQTGRLRLGYIDPAQIKIVMTDPQNVKIPIGVITKGWIGEIAGYAINQESKAYKTILPEEAEYVLSAGARDLRAQLKDGECFYYGINNVTNSPRGRSSLLSLADWLDAYEQFLWDYADKWPLLNAFVWDLCVAGGDDNELKKQLQAFTKKSGSVYAHNEKVTLTPSAPKLQSVEANDGARMFRNHIMGRFGYPEHWYGGGGDVNRATASEMDVPALKMLQFRQKTVKYILEDILGYAVSRSRKAAYLNVTDEDAKFTVSTPKLGNKDVSKLGSMVQQVAASLQVAELQEWIDKETARKIFVAIIGFTGVEVDLNEIEAAFAEEQPTKGYEDYKKKAQGPGRMAQGEKGNGNGKEKVIAARWERIIKAAQGAGGKAQG